MSNCVSLKFILRKIIKIVGIRCEILMLKCINLKVITFYGKKSVYRNTKMSHLRSVGRRKWHHFLSYKCVFLHFP